MSIPISFCSLKTYRNTIGSTVVSKLSNNKKGVQIELYAYYELQYEKNVLLIYLHRFILLVLASSDSVVKYYHKGTKRTKGTPVSSSFRFTGCSFKIEFNQQDCCKVPILLFLQMGHG